ncbi:glycosyltransferase family 4 protein [Microbacterium sp.]|uniref:glycosyltransferase family 4 protein n=1 Tax=Microbacterium sp. TaxID=51671 RepID=UPI001ACFE910|nr:glycosyltransferase family 4 protein [Microbacterium sp.]MBN9223176.1 glycosyltransferase family 4 protein [Microbacterium sp.]
MVEGLARLLGAGAMFLRLGPRRYLRRRRSIQEIRGRRGATFANGVTTRLTSSGAQAWHRVHWRPITIVLAGETSDDVAAWARLAVPELHAHLLVSPSTAARLKGIEADDLTIAGTEDAPSFDLVEIRRWMLRKRRNHDLLLLDASQPLPDTGAVIEMQCAAYDYHHAGEVGCVTPSYRTADGIISGYDVDRAVGEIAPARTPSADYGQSAIPRYVLTAGYHGFFVRGRALDRVDAADRELVGLDLDRQVAHFIRRAWAGNIRTLCFSSTELPVSRTSLPQLFGEQRAWAMQRTVTNAEGETRVVFVLNATSVSGGIRAVFELANGLSERGFDVDIWSLQDHPTWFDLRVPVRTFYSYEDLLLALRSVDAIKVATWWETAEIVWLASVNHGLPAYLIQEFETWFYPDDEVARAAVVASYRREFASITEASYQVGELESVGVTPTLIPHGYDPTAFHVIPDATRRDDAILALGRSFFQKNFAMTARAWQSLGDERPTFLLFGGEPDILDDPRVEYSVRPTDAQVNALYNSAALFVQTSRHEGFCLPILEAMAAGCPVITTDSHGNRDFCVDGVNCVIVPQDDDVALADTITRLMRDPEERERLSANGLRTAADYTWPIVLDRVGAFYRQLTASAAQGAPHPSNDRS